VIQGIFTVGDLSSNKTNKRAEVLPKNLFIQNFLTRNQYCIFHFNTLSAGVDLMQYPNSLCSSGDILLDNVHFLLGTQYYYLKRTRLRSLGN